MLVTLYKIGVQKCTKVHFRFLGTNGFHAKAKNERWTAAGSRCDQKCHVVIWQATLHQKACGTWSTINIPYLTNHIVDLWRLLLPLPSLFLKPLIVTIKLYVSDTVCSTSLKLLRILYYE